MSLNKQLKLNEARALIAGGPIQLEKLECPFFESGLVRGSIVELVGFGKTQLVSAFLKKQTDLEVAWVESEMSINPHALWQRGVSLNKILFVEAKAEARWALPQILAAGYFGVVVSSGVVYTEHELRRFQLQCERFKTVLIMLSDIVHKSWVPHLQLAVSRPSVVKIGQAQPQGLPEFGIEVLRQRGPR